MTKREPWTYRAVWRNTARGARALTYCRAYLAANFVARLIERKKLVTDAIDYVEGEIAKAYANGRVFSKRMYFETQRAAFAAFYKAQKRTRVIHRIIAELTSPAPTRIFAT